MTLHAARFRSSDRGMVALQRLAAQGGAALTCADGRRQESHPAAHQHLRLAVSINIVIRYKKRWARGKLGCAAANGVGTSRGTGAPTVQEVMTVVKLYKYQALVTLHPVGDGSPCPELDASPRRMVLLGQSDETGRSQFFTVLVSRDEDRTFGGRNGRVLVTLRVADDVAHYLGIGRHFNLWLGGDIGDGIVTRRLFV